MAINTARRYILLLCVTAVPVLAESVTLRNENFPSVVVEAKTGPDQQHVENATSVGTQTLSKGASWPVKCTRGEFVMYRSHEPANDWSDWTAAFCTGDTSVRISDGGKVH
jgi:hypothetical protein